MLWFYGWKYFSKRLCESILLIQYIVNHIVTIILLIHVLWYTLIRYRALILTWLKCSVCDRYDRLYNGYKNYTRPESNDTDCDVHNIGKKNTHKNKQASLGQYLTLITPYLVNMREFQIDCRMFNMLSADWIP